MNRGCVVCRIPTSWWAFVGVSGTVFVVLVGAFEGLYNHTLKDVLYLTGASTASMRVLFPAPIYEMPNDWFFEVTGVLQVVPAAAAACFLGRLIRARSRAAPRAGLEPRRQPQALT